MQPIGNELKRLEQRMIYRSEKCINHKVRLVEYKGVALCPRCFTEAEHATLEHQINNQYEQSKRFVLDRKSLLSDRTLLNASFENYRTKLNSEADSNKQVVMECVQRIQQRTSIQYSLPRSSGCGEKSFSLCHPTRIEFCEITNKQRSNACPTIMCIY